MRRIKANGDKVTREEIYSALAALIDVESVTRVSRQPSELANFQPSDSPMIFVDQLKETAAKPPARGIPTVWFFYVDIFIVIDTTEDSGTVGASLLNAILDEVEDAIWPGEGEKQTLGGLVQDCRIVGDVQPLEGTLGTRIIAVVPVEILV